MDVFLAKWDLPHIRHLIGTNDWLNDGRLAGALGLGLIVVLVLVSLFRARGERGNSPRAYAREQLSRQKDQRELHRDIEAALEQLEQVARQINTQLDARFERLDQAMRDADERVLQLERLLRRADGRPALDVTIGDAPETAPRAAAPSQARQRRIYELADSGRQPVEIAQELGQTTGEIELILALRRKAS